jgi:hypothetical protein
MNSMELPFSQEDRDLLRDTSKDVKAILEHQKAHSKEDDKRFAEHDIRLKALEKWHTSVTAIGAVVGSFVGLMTGLFGGLISKALGH